ncbi:MAG: PAS domain S-box protein, partial [Rhodocyclaceae bacterium]|nr:PAS domain S-box protein [Rhodocyclaceae bacterium]
MDGFETAELMRSNPKTRHLPIIFVTAGMKDLHQQFKGYELGAVDYLIKPFEPHILQSKVKVFCELYRQRCQLESNQALLETKIRERVAELRESEERFRTLATHAPVGIYQIDTAGNCLFVNPRWCEIAGLSAAAAAGEGWTRTIHPDDRDAVAAIWRKPLSPDSDWSMDYRFLCPDGKLSWVNGNAVALRNPQGEITGYLGNNLEITVRKRGEERRLTRSEVTGRLAGDAALPEILHLIAEGAERQTRGMSCSILLLDEAGQQLIYGAAPDLPDRVIGNGGGPACAAAATRGKCLVIDDINAHPSCADCRPPSLAGKQVSCWPEPILAMNGEVLGVFAFFWELPATPDPNDIELMREAAQLAGLSIERKRTENELQIAASVHRAISEAITVADADNRIIAINPAFTQVTGYAAHEAIGQDARLLKSGRHDLPFYQEMWHALETTGRWQGEIWNRRKNGEEYPEQLSINTLYDASGKVLRRIAMSSDITEKKRTEETIWRQANYDSLTELPNRRLFLDRLRQEVKKAQRANLHVALLFVDLDRFKEVNDALGHHTGDLLLIEAAHRIRDCVRATDTVAR